MPDRDRKQGYPFFEDVPDAKLSEWSKFLDSELFRFAIEIMDREVTALEARVGREAAYCEKPTLLADTQGYIRGIRRIMETFFGDIRREIKRRDAESAARE